MADDTTLHFPHPATHPDVVYAPRHLMNHAIPTASIVLLSAALVCALVAVALFSGLEIHRGKRIGVGLALLAALCATSGSQIAKNKGTFVGVLPERSHDMGLGQPDSGDDAHQYFFSRDDALAKARETGRAQELSDASAHAVAIRWNDLPAQDRQDMLTGIPNSSVLPNDTGWTSQDSLIIRDYLKKNYGVTPINTDDNKVQGYSQAVTAQGMDAETFPSDVSHSTLVNVPGNPMHLTDEYEHYRCLLHLNNYRKNDTGQPVSATPGTLECFSNFDVDGATTSVTAKTPRVFPKKLG